jgi:peptidoglycan/xylan/chitin deacetylase (PgdA/CDA1 family)
MPFRPHLKSLLGTALWPFAGSWAARRLIRRDQGLVLTFHYIGTPVLGGVAEDLFISLREFRRVLDFIAARLHPLAPAEFLRRIHEGTLPERATLITFDDCLHDTVVQAMPELVKRGLAACFFCSPGLMAADRTIPSLELMSICGASRRPDPVADYRRLWPELLRSPSADHPALLQRLRADFGLDGAAPLHLRLAGWGTLAALDAAGMLVGNHTMLHSTITADGARQFESDVAAAYDAIERRIGPRPRVFCYPYGRKVDQGGGAEDILRRLGTEFAFVTQGGIARPRRSGLLNLHREDASYSASATKLAPLLAFLR